MNNDIQNLVNELNSTTPKTQMYMIQLCRSAINNLYDLTDTIEENISSLQNSVVANTSAISGLQTNVATNTTAISGLQSSIDVINTNLNAYVIRIATLENITTHITSNEYNTLFNESIDVAEDIKAGGDVKANGDISGNVLEVDNEEGRGRFYIDDDGDMCLGLPPNAGKLITTGNIDEYASAKTYLHRISFQSVNSAGSTSAKFSITIQNGNNNNFTFNDICDFLNNLGFTSENYLYNATGLYHEYSIVQPYTYHTITGIYVNYSLKRIVFVNENNDYTGTTTYANAILSQKAIEL